MSHRYNLKGQAPAALPTYTKGTQPYSFQARYGCFDILFDHFPRCFGDLELTISLARAVWRLLNLRGGHFLKNKKQKRNRRIGG